MSSSRHAATAGRRGCSNSARAACGREVAAGTYDGNLRADARDLPLRMPETCGPAGAAADLRDLHADEAASWPRPAAARHPWAGARATAAAAARNRRVPVSGTQARGVPGREADPGGGRRGHRRAPSSVLFSPSNLKINILFDVIFRSQFYNDQSVHRSKPPVVVCSTWPGCLVQVFTFAELNKIHVGILIDPSSGPTTPNSERSPVSNLVNNQIAHATFF